MADSSITTFDALACSNVNAAWGALTLEVLARLGVETVVVSPGSRSTALTFAAARNSRIDAVSILDERSAAFFALGVAKRTHKPVVLVCTSGSAAANYFPAVMEASMSGTPLLVFTADRPPELRDCSSGQTVDQLKLYGDYVRSFVEVALPDVQLFPYLRQTLVHALDRALNDNPGPVHLNFPFRDPLAPCEDEPAYVDSAILESAATVMTRACEAVRCGLGFDAVAIERMCSHQRGLIIVGSMNPREGDEAFADAVTMLSRKLGWPVLSDVLNPLRGHAGEIPDLVTRYDAFMRVAGESVSAPTAILQIGPLPTSKVLRAWLEGLDAVTFLLSERPVNLDPLHRVATVLRGESHTLAALLSHQKVDVGWIDLWSTFEHQTRKRLDEKLAGIEELFEGKVAWMLSQAVPVGSSVFFASSMSVRYAEYFWNAGSRACSVFANRGANGIDGTLSTAMGLAHGGKPTILLTGDLAFLHDANGLLASSRLSGSLTVVLINNNGGGIFEYLPVAAMEEVFEEFFATPQTVTIEKLCRAHGVTHTLVSDWVSFQAELAAPIVPGVRVIEVPTDRKFDQELLAQILAT